MATSGRESIWADGKATAVIKKLSFEKLRRLVRDNLSLEELEALDVSSRGIEEIESLDGLTKLRKLQIAHNKLRRLRGIASLKAVTYFDASDNQLTAEGIEDVRDLESLRVLNLSHNKLQALLPRMFKSLTNLQAVILNNNLIDRVRFISSLKSVNTLVLSHNSIENIPDEIFEGFHELTKLSLSHNNLTQVPQVERCFSLQELRLSHNRIQIIPEWMNTLRKLKTLDLGFNRIDSWTEVRKLVHSKYKLKQLTLKGNPIETESNVKDTQEEEEEENSEKKAQEHKSYDETMAELFPKIVVRDDRRIKAKKIHGIVAESDEELENAKTFDEKQELRQLAKRNKTGTNHATMHTRGAPATAEQKQRTGKRARATDRKKRHDDSDEDEEGGAGAGADGRMSKLERDMQEASNRVAMSGVVGVEIVGEEKKQQAPRKRHKSGKHKDVPAAKEQEPMVAVQEEVIVPPLIAPEVGVGLGGPSVWDDDDI